MDSMPDPLCPLAGEGKLLQRLVTAIAQRRVAYALVTFAANLATPELRAGPF